MLSFNVVLLFIIYKAAMSKTNNRLLFSTNSASSSQNSRGDREEGKEGISVHHDIMKKSIFSMGRKRNQGKARKAAKAMAREEEEERANNDHR
eukprot:scaffold23477_cov81-Skeletonema_dohrnii-CCMP3373.AAC.1